MCGGFNRPNGIPLPEYLHNRLPEETQKAFVIFDAWFKSQEIPATGNMPTEVLEAFEKIKKTPIPGYPGHTCAESCYILGVESMLVTE